MIKFIFGISLELPVLAYSSKHRVTGLTLPPVDANPLFHYLFSWSEDVKKEIAMFINCSLLRSRAISSSLQPAIDF